MILSISVVIHSTPRTIMKMLSFAALAGRRSSPLLSSIRQLATRGVSGSNSSYHLDDLIRELRKLDTACIADADKMLLAKNKGSSSSSDESYKGIRLMSPSIRRINNNNSPGSVARTMAGVAFTVQFEQSNDFLAIPFFHDQDQSEDVSGLFCSPFEIHCTLILLSSQPSRTEQTRGIP